MESTGDELGKLSGKKKNKKPKNKKHNKAGVIVVK